MLSLTRRPVALTALASGLLLAAVAPVSATTIDFQVGPPVGGLITHTGSGPLVGTNIPIDVVSATDTPSNAGDYTCTDCVLNFTSGDLITSGPDFWVFEGGGEITITGTLSTPTGDVPILMQGTFLGPQLTVDLFSPGPFDFGISVALFMDTKNQELTDYFGLHTDNYNGFMILGWGGFAENETGGDIFATSLGGVVRNQPAVPEPATVVLLGAGLLGLAARRRRRSDT